jgi:hypothetical protein
LKIVLVKSEFHSTIAQRTGRALANGHPAIDRHVLRQFGKRGFHQLTVKKKHY